MIEDKIKKVSVPMPSIRRLPLYLCFLKSKRKSNTKFITAKGMAKELLIDSTQITKDLSSIRVKGKAGVGYGVEILIGVIESYLAHHICRKAIIVGVGNLGTALINFTEFGLEGMEIIKGFDISDEVIGKEINSVLISHINTIDAHFKLAPADIGIITVPANEAQKIAGILIKHGIKALWNFSTMPISAPDDIIVENTCIDSSLAVIKWKLNRNIPLMYKNRVI